MSIVGALWIARAEIDRRHNAFQVDSRIAHRLLSQRAVEHEAVLAMLALLQPGSSGADQIRRLSAIYPQVLRVERRPGDGQWQAESPGALASAEAESRRLRRPVGVVPDHESRSFWLVLAAAPASYALLIDVPGMVPREDWPSSLAAATRIVLKTPTGDIALAHGLADNPVRKFVFRKTLAADSQAFELELTRVFASTDLPWSAILLWTLGTLLATTLAARVRALVLERRRAEERLRIGQADRLNALGELAAGLAHELNQPLTAVLSNAQAAKRLLAEESVEMDLVREAVSGAAAQARRAADVLSRLRRTVERPRGDWSPQRLPLLEFVRRATDLVEPEPHARKVRTSFLGPRDLAVRVDPVALEQIVHNLVSNAVQAMEQVSESSRRLDLSVEANGDIARLTISDSGPGIPPESLPRLFEPFYSTRRDGLGLGLSLSESLAVGMGGRLIAANGTNGGAEFTLELPKA